MKEVLTAEEVRLVFSLVPGDNVEASDPSGARWGGKVDITHPPKGLVWIHTHQGERMLLDIHEHTIRRMGEL
ncbi:hypothetical protein [Pseudarthrobacter sp. NKDBFgelt]|uniref:hypothetical protein n=1 Tax=Pseudarthrobacter sp. NKDBFgelt TaxID=3384443 RepID=UPI0038D49659